MDLVISNDGSSSSNIKYGYMPQMDGLRAIAVFGVLVHHWFKTDIPWGSWGVILFFVLSGYLITRSIRGYLDRGISTWTATRHFFMRRTVRLFPAYYLLIFCASILFDEVRRDWLWYVSYVSNFLIDQRQAWIPLSPTWSLAVEEQFYLIWFFVAITISWRKVNSLVLLLALVAPIARWITFTDGNAFGVYLIWHNCDALAAGVFLYKLEKDGQHIPAAGGLLVVAALAASVMLTLRFQNPLDHPVVGTFVPVLIAIIASYLVWVARMGFEGLLGRLLGHPVVIYIGRISYGIYLYHMITPAILLHLEVANTAIARNILQLKSLPGFALHVMLTVGIAAISFHVLERPLQRTMTASLIRRDTYS